RILPGTYTVLAVAQGFNPMTLLGVEVGRAAEVSYGFKLEKAGNGNTLPEKRADKNSSKWRIRAAQMSRSIYQNRAGSAPVVEETIAVKSDKPASKKGQTVVETYFAGTDKGGFFGVNMATLVPLGGSAEIVFAGQTGKGVNAPQRFETDLTLRPNAKHQVRISGSAGRLGTMASAVGNKALGQVSLQGTDEWRLKSGAILILGLDYSKFVGAGSDSSFTPRIGFQYDVDARTRLRAAFTPAAPVEKSWANAIDLEGQQVAFADPVAVNDLVTVNGKPQMNKSRRLEFGVERVLDDRSSVEANFFFDTTPGRGVGFNAVSFNTLGGDGFSEFVSDQTGSARGARVVYTRRLTDILTTSAGYAFGNGQHISPEGLGSPSKIFEGGVFQSFFAQLAADLKTGTHVQTVFRLSPEATIFAIDPFKGRLAIYDPGLSVYVTQALPRFGLPIHAQAIVDARNLFNFQSGLTTDEGTLRLNGVGRMLRGGIQVRF
ncbi:MAG: TonB-dependent receptor, partial [Acidobacteria bacterium]|nr:TonB-dependent receptor [Acidobacteriota bacterium]